MPSAHSVPLARALLASRFRASVPITDDWEHFRFAVSEGVATVTLDRPEKKNPLTFESYAELRGTFEALRHAEDVKAVVIWGGERVFATGADMTAPVEARGVATWAVGPTHADAVSGCCHGVLTGKSLKAAS